MYNKYFVSIFKVIFGRKFDEGYLWVCPSEGGQSFYRWTFQQLQASNRIWSQSYGVYKAGNVFPSRWMMQWLLCDIFQYGTTKYTELENVRQVL